MICVNVVYCSKPSKEAKNPDRLSGMLRFLERDATLMLALTSLTNLQSLFSLVFYRNVLRSRLVNSK